MKLPEDVQYGLQHKQSGLLLKPKETLASAGIRDGDTIRLLPNVTAGAVPVGDVPCLDHSSIRDFTVDELKKSSDAAPIMLIRLYEEATVQAKNLRSQLDAERQK